MSAKGENPLSSSFYERFYRNEPEVLLDKPGYAILWKPHNMHSAPLAEGEQGNLLTWYLSLPDIPDEARRVIGKKRVECGLLHRLDFATAGLVLVAKTQGAFYLLEEAQKEGRFVKGYRAFCNCSDKKSEKLPYREGSRFCVKSRFRVFGQGGREVRPVFASDGEGKRRKDRRISPKEYYTNIDVEKITDDGRFASLLCSLEAGFRHQVRAHLASCGFPVCGDQLYNPLCKMAPANKGGKEPSAFMQLIAVNLSFPDPQSSSSVFFSLPPKDKTSLQLKG